MNTKYPLTPIQITKEQYEVLYQIGKKHNHLTIIETMDYVLNEVR